MQAGLAAGWPVIAEQFSSIIPEVYGKIESLTGQIPQLLEGITRIPFASIMRFTPRQYFFRGFARRSSRLSGHLQIRARA